MRRLNVEETDVPWQVEIWFAIVGLLAFPVPRLLFAMFASTFNDLQIIPGTSLNLSPALDSLAPLTWMLGLVWWWKLRCYARGWLLRRLPRF